MIPSPGNRLGEGFLFKSLTLPLSAILATTGAMPAAAQDDLVILEPATNWNLDYGEDRCRLARLFASGEDKTVFWIEQTGPDASFSWLSAGGIVKRLGSVRNVSVAFGSFPEYELSAHAALELEGFGDALSGKGYEKQKLPADNDTIQLQDKREPILDTAAGAQIEHIDFVRKGRLVRLATGNMKDAFAALNACSADLYVHWGLDAAELGASAEGAKPKNMQHVARKIQAYYPSKAEGRGESAIMKLRILVGIDGKVDKCILIKETKAENFDDYACEVISEDAEFEPATDAQGNPVRSIYSFSVRYFVN